MTGKLSAIQLFLLVFTVSLFAAEPYRVLVLGDLHYDDVQYHAPKAKVRDYVGMWKKDQLSLLKEAAAHTDKTFPFVIQVGDISTGDAYTMELQEKILRDAFHAVKKYFPNHKLLAIKGNHDVRLATKSGRVVSNEPAAKALLPLIAKEAGFKELKTGNWSIMHGQDLYIFLDGFDKKFNTVKFTENQLKAHPKTRYVFLVTHLPVLPSDLSQPKWLQPHYEKLAMLLASRNGIILGGHIHAFSVISYEFPGKGRVTQLLSNSVALSWKKTAAFVPKVKSYAEYVSLRKKGKKPYQFEQFFPASGYKEFLLYPAKFCTGYTILEISDQSVTAQIYNGPGSKPHPFVLLKRKP